MKQKSPAGEGQGEGIILFQYKVTGVRDWDTREVKYFLVETPAVWQVGTLGGKDRRLQ
ncbi:hypothetical protein JXO59_14790 [candidate division KSB1 bacterium]|nr:hypothetical protein [candidate division KSB1 bacterium]